MDLEKKRYVIGIDLGTTNSAVSYVDLDAIAADASAQNDAKKSRIKIFNPPQLVGPGEIGRLPVLPSFLYIPGTYDISKDAIRIPWKTSSDNFSGTFARDHGAKVPARLVSSAKSWLCHGNVDRKAKILPWGSGSDVFKVSPVQATAAYLEHIKKAWNMTKGDDEEAYLENQVIVLTVPASFDEVARDLTVEAAAMADLKNITLLEEPLAAFYSWLISHEKDWHNYVHENELILVCDIGGGTTDFTLITLQYVDGSLRFERIAVGDHLILGGDNIDLALARRVEKNFGKNKPALTGDRWKTLCHYCRHAKENILDGRTDRETITLMGEGSSLIAGTISAQLSREELETTVLDGFFPLVNASETKAESPSSKKGITEFGLPYEQEPAMTKHLGWFLEHHRKDVETLLHKHAKPDLVLFNGGSLKPEIIREKIRAAIRHWFDEPDTGVPRVLENPNPDLAVALGAAYYGLVKVGEGVKVGSGSARGYYLRIATKDQENGSAAKSDMALCLVERGVDEGSRIDLTDKKFDVLANQPVSFEIYSSSYRSGDRHGDVVEIDDSMTPLPPIQTVVEFGKKGEKKAIPVTIEADYTEMGTLALYCRSQVSTHRWRLQFQLRDTTEHLQIDDDAVLEETTVTNACNEVKQAFSPNTAKQRVTRLMKTITTIVEHPKKKWPLSFIRSLSDELLKVIDTRALTLEHEKRWLNLTGFCLRPGFGDGFDPQRVKKLWKIFKQGTTFSKNQQILAEWWILWRRVAAGLSAGQQRQFSQDLMPLVFPKKNPPRKIGNQELLEIWMAIANMERMLISDKIKWGRYFLNNLQPDGSKPQHFWALSRIGARELLYGPADKVVSPNEISVWINKLLKKKWPDTQTVGNTLSQLGRMTGDRMRDITPDTADRIVSWMTQNGCPASHIRRLKEVVPVAKQEENAIFGESLPAGMILHI